MKSLLAPNLKTIALTKVMYVAIHRYEDQAFDDITKESEKTFFECFIVKKSLRPVPNQGMVEKVKKHGGFKPQQGYLGYALRPQRAWWPRMHLIKDIIK